MTTRRDVLIAAAALPLLVPPSAKADGACSVPPDWRVEHVGPGHYTITHGWPKKPFSTWLLTRQQIVETEPYVTGCAPGRLDTIGQHQCLPQQDRVQLAQWLRSKYAAPCMTERWHPEHERLLVVVGEYEDIQELESTWRATATPYKERIYAF